jgi:tRNA(Ile)-lysidine synthase TilS/MesJ
MNVEKAALKAIRDYRMLIDGDRVLVGASGGKDSLTLSLLLSRLAARRHPALRVEALLVIGGGAPEPSADRLDALSSLYRDWGMPLHFLRRERIEGKRDCYRCSVLRREALMAFALERGFNRIALGHHLDDILTTVLMNLVGRGNAEGMEAFRDYGKFGVALIRPLAYVPEESIRRLCGSMGWSAATCSCPQGDSGPHGGRSVRAEYRRRLEVLTGGDLAAKRRLYAALFPVLTTLDRG